MHCSLARLPARLSAFWALRNTLLLRPNSLRLLHCSRAAVRVRRSPARPQSCARPALSSAGMRPSGRLALAHNCRRARASAAWAHHSATRRPQPTRCWRRACTADKQFHSLPLLSLLLLLLRLLFHSAGPLPLAPPTDKLASARRRRPAKASEQLGTSGGCQQKLADYARAPAVARLGRQHLRPSERVPCSVLVAARLCCARARCKPRGRSDAVSALLGRLTGNLQRRLDAGESNALGGRRPERLAWCFRGKLVENPRQIGERKLGPAVARLARTRPLSVGEQRARAACGTNSSRPSRALLVRLRTRQRACSAREREQLAPALVHAPHRRAWDHSITALWGGRATAARIINSKRASERASEQSGRRRRCFCCCLHCTQLAWRSCAGPSGGARSLLAD